MEHYIELIDGTRIEAFPKTEQPETIKEDKLALDTTVSICKLVAESECQGVALNKILSPNNEASYFVVTCTA